MKRELYVAGVNMGKLAKMADHIPHWLISVTLTRSKRTGIPHEWLIPYLHAPHRKLLYDPGTFSDGAVTYEEYLQFIQDFARPQDRYLQYDIIGDAEQTTFYLGDMREKGYDPVPVYQRGCDTVILHEEQVAIGGLVRMSAAERFRYLDNLFYNIGVTSPHVHLLGMIQPKWFKRYPADGGDSTTWIQMVVNGRQGGGHEEWLAKYGEQEIPYIGPESVQYKLEV